MELNVKEMIGGGPARLRWVYRYSTSRVRHPESVAEHSFFVAFYTLCVGWWVKDEGYKLDLLQVMERAILHDLEEAVSGDFPRSFKHSDREMKRMLDIAAEKAFHQLLNPVVGDEHVSPAHELFFRTWHDSKDHTLEGRVLEFCDFLAVLGFLLQEGMGEGNGMIGIHVADMSTYYGKFQRPEFDFLRPLIQQAGSIMQQLGIEDTDLVRKGKGTA